MGYVGSIQSVNIDLVNEVLESDSIPVIAPMGFQSSEMLNINADIANAHQPNESVDLEELNQALTDFKKIIQ